MARSFCSLVTKIGISACTFISPSCLTFTVGCSQQECDRLKCTINELHTFKRLMGMTHRSVLVASAHKMQNQQHFPHNNTSQFYTTNTPGSVNILLGGAMLGTMILFFMWMCYFCRCKVPKSEETSSTSSTPPYWIDVESDLNERGSCDDDYYHSYRRYSEDISSLRRPSPPPTYESVFNLPPTYEDAMKSLNDVKEIKEHQ